MNYVTDTNLTPLIQIITWLTLAISLFSMIARAATKVAIIRVVSLDDYYVSISMFFSVFQIVAVTIQTTHGLGKLQNTLSSADLGSVLKGEYAANLLYVLSLCFAKLSVLALIRLITPKRRTKSIMLGLQAAIVAWAVTADFAFAFQCQVPEPWNYITGHCVNRISLWNYFEITNIITDTGLIILPILILWKVHTSIKNKAGIVSFFAIRIAVIISSTCKLVYLNRLSSSPDTTLSLWPVHICTEVIQCASIVASCCLYVRPFLESLQSGFLNLDDLKRRGVDSRSELSNNIALSDRKKDLSGTGRFSRLTETVSAEGIYTGNMINEDRMQKDSGSKVIVEGAV